MRLFFYSLFFALFGSHAFAGGEAHVLPKYAEEVFRVGPVIVTNSMVASFIVVMVLIVFAQLAARNVQVVPQGLQNFAEAVVEALENFLAGIMGRELTKKTFWFFGSLFIFILTANWAGLFPGVGTIGWQLSDGHYIPWLRGANADVNMTLGLASIFFLLWIIWSIKANGVGGFFSHIFIYHGDAKGFILLILYPIFFAVGILEVVSICIRPISLTFRLFGNVFAGETLLEKTLFMGGNFGFLTALPFYGLELLVGAIQALVFTLLTAVFTSLMCKHDDKEAH